MKDGSEENKPFNASVNDLIALGHIVDEFEKFNSQIKELIWGLRRAHIGSLQIGHCILMASKNKFVFQRKIRKFYAENKRIINTIMQHTGIVEFIAFNYNNDGQLRPGMNFFYQYMLENKDKLGQILSLLEHLKKLKFQNISFDASLGEKSSEHLIKRYYSDNIRAITYSDGIEILPNALPGLIKYEIVGANYIMSLSPTLPAVSKPMKHNGEITVKNLLFGVEKLPEDLSRENTFDKILELSKSQEENCVAVKQSVHLSVIADDFQKQYDYATQIMNILDDAETKEELLKILEQIKIQLDKMQSISTQYDATITQDGSDITQEQLQREKQFYLDRRSKMQ